MKIRIENNSLKLRVAQSDPGRLIEADRIETTACLGTDEEATLRHALEDRATAERTKLRYRPGETAVVLSSSRLKPWKESEHVGIYATIGLGIRGSLDILVERDYACLDLSDAENVDSFPYPLVCELP